MAGDINENTELQYNGLSIDTEVSRMCHSSFRLENEQSGGTEGGG